MASPAARLAKGEPRAESDSDATGFPTLQADSGRMRSNRLRQSDHGPIRFVTNQRGYTGEETGFDPAFVLEV